LLITNDEKEYRAGEKIKLEVNADKTHLFDLEPARESGQTSGIGRIFRV
jgi:hypothetical protein